MSHLESEISATTKEAGTLEALTVADAVWLGTALLQKRSASGSPFTTEEIAAYISELNLTQGSYKSIWQHVNQHCVANRKPNPNRTRMLFATGEGNRRLFRDGDRYDPAREGSATHPDWSKLPERYRWIRQWYETEWNRCSSRFDPLLALIGSGKEIWKDEHADEYVAALRGDWTGE